MGTQAGQSAPPTIFNQGLFEESSVKKHRYGTRRILDDGRVFRYAGITAAAVAAAAGGVLLSKVQTPVDATVAAADAALAIIDANEVSVTAAGVTKNQFADGYLVIKAGTGIGQMYKIRGNGATDGIATGRVAISLYDKIITTWVAASTTIALHENPYKDLLINPAVASGAATTQETVMGMATRPLTASYFAWIQTRGLAALVLDIDAAAGAEANEMEIVAGTTAGRGRVVEDTGPAGQQIIGYTLESADLTDAEGNLVFLTIE